MVSVHRGQETRDADAEVRPSGSAGVDWVSRPFGITYFQDFGANNKEAKAVTLPALAEQVRITTAAEKAQLPWLKLARFGDKRSRKNSLRHDANVLAITGIEADYDGEVVPFEEAADLLLKCGVLALLYTSPSHTADKPRWRVLCPTSTEREPSRRHHLMGRLNGLLRGVASAESWTLSQSYYFGCVRNNPDHLVQLLDGTPIDLLDELDTGWQGKPNTGPSTSHSDGRTAYSGSLDEQALLGQLRSGEAYHAAMVRLAGKWALDGVPLVEARYRLVAAMEEVPSEKQDDRWLQRFADINRCVLDIYSKEAGKQDAPDANAANGAGQLAPEQNASRPKALGPPTGRTPLMLLPGRQALCVGSDVEIAQCIAQDFSHVVGLVVYTEGSFWYHSGTHWQAIADNELRKVVHAYDGVEIEGAAREARTVKLGKSRINSILNELGALCAQPAFFGQTPAGINCLSGFIRFSPLGTPTLEPHTPDHRCRHVLPGRWQDGHFHGIPPGSLLSRLLRGSFANDADEQHKIDVLAEVLAAAALGTATRLRQPRAVILKGETAENGKSQVLDLARGLLPAAAVASVTIGRMGDERHIVGLVGRLLNACDEISSSAAIASDTFKAIVTGEPVEGRDVYRSRTDFRATAQHLFATNTLPAFRDGMDRGVRRRLMIITFNRVIPLEERIEQIGQRIGTEETDQLLAWVVDGGSRLIRNGGFGMPPSSKAALYDWIHGSDPVLAWIDVCLDQHSSSDDQITIKAARQAFLTWAVAEGFNLKQLPYINGFTQRVLAGATWVSHRRTSRARLFVGLKFRTADDA